MRISPSLQPQSPCHHGLLSWCSALCAPPSDPGNGWSYSIVKREKRQSTPSMTKMGHAQNVCHFRLFNPVGNCNLRENKLERRGYTFLLLSLKANEPKAKHVGGSSDGFSLCIHTGDPCRSHSWCLSRSFVASQTGSCISSGHRLCPPCLAAENMACEWGGAGVRGLEGGSCKCKLAMLEHITVYYVTLE